jgi:hypothetical protein
LSPLKSLLGMAMLTMWISSQRPSRSKSQDATKRKIRMQRQTTTSLVSSSEPNYWSLSKGARTSSRTWRNSTRSRTKMTSTSKLKTRRERRMKLSDAWPLQSIISHQLITLSATRFKEINESVLISSHFLFWFLAIFILTRNSFNPPIFQS